MRVYAHPPPIPHPTIDESYVRRTAMFGVVSVGIDRVSGGLIEDWFVCLLVACMVGLFRLIGSRINAMVGGVIYCSSGLLVA